MAAVHGHQQGPGGHECAFAAHDVRRSLDPVDALFGQYAAVVDEVTGAAGEFDQLLGRLHGAPGVQIDEQLAQDVRDVQLAEERAGLLLVDHVRGGHAGFLD
ncbi:hypothetical protein D3C85_1441580 [compost metagenome]